MPTDTPSPSTSRHLRITDPSPWVVRFAPLIAPGGRVLDLACGGGRHGRYLRSCGHSVTFVDQNTTPLDDLRGDQGADILGLDLENGQPWPFAHDNFDAVVVTNYLHRPLLPHIVDVISDGGVLIYETFARGNEAYSRPRNPDHLLRHGELLEAVRDHMMVVGYESGVKTEQPLPGVVQRICAVKPTYAAGSEDPQPRALTP